MATQSRGPAPCEYAVKLTLVDEHGHKPWSDEEMLTILHHSFANCLPLEVRGLTNERGKGCRPFRMLFVGFDRKDGIKIKRSLDFFNYDKLWIADTAYTWEEVKQNLDDPSVGPGIRLDIVPFCGYTIQVYSNPKTRNGLRVLKRSSWNGEYRVVVSNTFIATQSQEVNETSTARCRAHSAPPVVPEVWTRKVAQTAKVTEKRRTWSIRGADYPEENECEREYTTVIWRNLPRELSSYPAYIEKTLEMNGFFSLVDTVYTPRSWYDGKGEGLCHAVVNFKTHEEAVRFKRTFHGQKIWAEPKVCEVTWFQHQGQDRVKAHYQSKNFEAVPPEWLPIVEDNGILKPLPLPMTGGAGRSRSDQRKINAAFQAWSEKVVRKDDIKGQYTNGLWLPSAQTP